MERNPNHIDLGAWRQAHHRNPVIARPLRFLREKLVIGKTPKGELIWHPAMKRAERLAKNGDGRALQLLAQRVNVLGVAALPEAAGA